MKKIIIGFLAVMLLGCAKKERIVEKFSAEKPYAIQIAKERSFYQAEKLTKRLLEMDINAYMVMHVDSSENDGSWFYIMCDNIEVLDSAKSQRLRIEESLKLKDLKIAAYSDFQYATFELDSLKLNEKKKIAANKPSVKEDVFDVITKFPESNSLYIQKTFVVNTPADRDNLKGFGSIYNFQMDLPRGITHKMILQRMSAFSEVIYEDNLYGDRVTIDIGKLRDKRPQINNATIINFENKVSFEIAEEYADLILATGEYLFEEKEEVEVNSFVKLYGYKVTIEPRRDYFRTYLVMVDASKQYIIFCQSTDKTKEELYLILSDLGKGDGLNSYDEFYNSFYTLPDDVVNNDWFIGFTLDKLGRSYAKNKGYTKWSREMVGHWNATGYFYNQKKGIWTYSIFDMLTDGNQNYIYGDLYSKEEGVNKKRQQVYNTNGFVIYEEKIDWSKLKKYKKLSEISFGVDRFIAAIGSSEDSWFTKEELVERAESLQFKDSTKE